MARKKSVKSTLILLVILGAYFVFKYESPEPETPLSGLTSPEFVDESYEVLENCRLVSTRRNDGDSFTVKHANGETEFRLYYVDAPESAYKEYRNGENNGKRLDQQAQYFSIERQGAIDTGVAAKDFMKYLMENEPFTVVTKWENVYSPERKYAFVVVEYSGQQAYLHELLVQNGLARIHTKPATMPNGKSQSEQLAFLKQLERSAKEQKLGAWAP